MGWLVVMAVFAAFGLWVVLFAWFCIPAAGEPQPVLFLDEKRIAGICVFPQRYLLARDLGFRVVVVAATLTETERKKLENSVQIEIWSPEEYLRYLETERNRIAGTGNGDHPGRDQCRGISEL